MVTITTKKQYLTISEKKLQNVRGGKQEPKKQKNLCNNVLLYNSIFVQNNYITMGGMDVNFWGIPLNWSNSTTI